MPSRAGFRHATDEQNHGAVHRKGNSGVACEISPGSSAADCRVAGRDHPRPAPLEPCMGLSIHTAQASAKASFDTRFHNCISGRLMISTAIEMVHLKVACGIRPALGSLHNMTNIPGGALCNGFLAGRTHAILPSPNTVKLRTAFGASWSRATTTLSAPGDRQGVDGASPLR